jgi:hypothetical protein
MADVDIIGRLEGVRQHGEGRWTARCPAHPDKSPSLSVAFTGDGMWLLHCFAGCDPLAIVGALGLKLDDLFPDARHDKRDSRPVSRQRHLTPSQRLALIEHEARVVYIAACDIRRGTPLSGVDQRRLEEAICKIEAVTGYQR